MIMESSLRPTYSNAFWSTIISRINEFQILIQSCKGKIEAYNEVVKNEFLALEGMSSIDDGKLRYDMFVKAYNEAREHEGINGLTPSEMFLQRLISFTMNTKVKQLQQL
jgi:Integrase core domain